MVVVVPQTHICDKTSQSYTHTHTHTHTYTQSELSSMDYTNVNLVQLRCSCLSRGSVLGTTDISFLTQQAKEDRESMFTKFMNDIKHRDPVNLFSNRTRIQKYQQAGLGTEI